MSKLIAITLLTAGAVLAGDTHQTDESAVRALIEKWDAAYHSLDGKAMAELETPEFYVVNREGTWTVSATEEKNARLWNWSFRTIYKGKPGPKHKIETVRFIHPDVAAVYATGFWPDPITLDNGYVAPPHGEIVTFLVVREKDGWRIVSENIHNQLFPGGPRAQLDSDRMIAEYEEMLKQPKGDK